MPHVDWRDDHHDTVVIAFHKPFTWNAFYAAVEQAQGLISAQQPRPVRLVVWYKANPPAGNSMIHIRNAQNSMPANTERVYIVVESNNALMRFYTLISASLRTLFHRESDVVLCTDISETYDDATP